MITSPANPKLRYLRGLQRRAFRAREGRVALEGARLVADALAAGVRPAFVLVTPAFAAGAEGQALLDGLAARDVPVLAVDAPLLEAACQTATPQGIVAVVPSAPPPWPPAASLVVVVDGLRDQGNLGTLLRSALAAGADGALLAPGTVDAGHDKALRAGMGAQFRLPHAALGWPELARRLAGLSLWVADARGETPHTAVDWRVPSAVAIGGETAGPGAEVAALARGRVRIPMAGPAESLNAATAAAVILFEAARQRQLPAGLPRQESSEP